MSDPALAETDGAVTRLEHYPVTFFAIGMGMLGLTLAQLYRPGVPVMLGICTLPFSMRSMLPVFGDPVTWMGQYAGVQLARRLGLPAFSYGAMTSAKTNEQQAGYESGHLLTHAHASGADFILHAAGWLEQGRTASGDKFEQDEAMIARLLDKQEAAPVGLGSAMAAEAKTRFSALLPRAAALVFHGGIGTSADVLQAGIPALVTPWGMDQFDNSWLLQQHGVARELGFAKVTADRLSASLGALLADPAVPPACAAAAARFEGIDPFAAACAQLEAFAPERADR